MAEHVADGDIGAAGIVERGHDIRPDKTGATGHQQHDTPCPDLWDGSFAPVSPSRQLGSCDVVKTGARCSCDFTSGRGAVTPPDWSGRTPDIHKMNIDSNHMVAE